MLQPHTNYYCDLRGKYAYILLNGDQKLIHDLLELLPERGLCCTLSGSSRYPAGNGRQYQKFLRIETSSGTKPTLTQLFDVINIYNRTTAGLNDTNWQIEKLKRELEETQNELQKLISGGSLYPNTESNALEELRLELEVSRLKAELETQQTSAKLTEKQLAEYKELFATFSDEHTQLENQLFMAEERVRTLQSNQETRKSESASRDSAEKSSEAIEIGEILCAIFPEIEFLKESLDVLKFEFSDPIPCVKNLRQIVLNETQGKPVKSADGWFEVHVRTGMSDDGRLYFSHLKSSKKYLLISRKCNQKQDIEYLKTIDIKLQSRGNRL